MSPKEIIEHFEKLRRDAIKQSSEALLHDDDSELYYQFGRAVAYRTVVAKLEEQAESEGRDSA